MFQKVQEVLEGGLRTVETLMNPDTVLWLEASRKGEMGKSHVAVLGGKNDAQNSGKIVHLDLPLQQALALLAPNAVELQRDDRTGRRQFQNQVYVVMDRVRLITPTNDYFKIEFSDGSILGVKDMSNIAGA